MKKQIVTIITLLMISIACVGCSNNELSNIDYTFGYSFQCEQTPPVINDKHGVTTVECLSDAIVSLNYKTPLDYYSPYSFYVVTCQFNSDFPNRNVYMTANDYNRDHVVSYINETDNCIQRVLKSNEKGEISFNIELGTVDCPFRGVTSVEIVSVVEIENDANYKMFESENHSIRMVFRSEDLVECSKTSAELQVWLNYLETIRNDIKCFSGNIEPYDGHTDYICTEEFPYYGLSGNPIYINCRFVVDDLNSITISENPWECTLLWKYIHEMSHTFDGFESDKINGYWNFDSEFWASLKVVFSLNTNGYGMEKYNPSKEDIFSFFSWSDTLKNGVYSSDGLIYTLCKTLSQYASEDMWSVIHNAMMTCERTSKMPLSNNEKFRLFWNNLNNELGFPLERFLSSKEWLAITSKYDLKE